MVPQKHEIDIDPIVRLHFLSGFWMLGGCFWVITPTQLHSSFPWFHDNGESRFYTCKAEWWMYYYLGFIDILQKYKKNIMFFCVFFLNNERVLL